MTVFKHRKTAQTYSPPLQKFSGKLCMTSLQQWLKQRLLASAGPQLLPLHTETANSLHLQLNVLQAHHLFLHLDDAPTQSPSAHSHTVYLFFLPLCPAVVQGPVDWAVS